MLYSELHELTGNRCTQAEYDAINAVYMELEEMSKEDAAKLWKKLFYARWEARKAQEQAEKESREISNLAKMNEWDAFLTLPNGKSVWYEVITKRGAGFTNTRVFYTTIGLKEVAIAYQTKDFIKPTEGNPFKLTRNGVLIEA